jgi:hypothetical protein
MTFCHHLREVTEIKKQKTMSFKKLNKNDFKKLMGTDGSETNQNHIILQFFDFDLAPDFITDQLGLEALSTGQKGEEYFIGPQKQISRIRECSHWEYEWKIHSNDFIGEMIDQFFKEIIIPRVDLIKEIGRHCETVRLTVVQYYYTGHNPGYGFDKRQIKILSAINAEVDMDIYCLCGD